MLRTLRDFLVPFVLIIVFLFVVWFRLKHDLPAMPDFYRAYYPAGRLIFENPENLYGVTKPVVYGFVNLPIFAYLLAPLAVFNEKTAGFLFTIFGVASVLLSAFWLIKITGLYGWKRNLLFAFFTFGIPFYNSIWLGNSTHFILLLVIGSWVCFRSGRDLWSGFFLALAGLIKIPLLFPIIYFILKKRWYVVFGFSATLLGIVGLSILVCGLPLNLTWLKECILSFSGTAIAAYNVQSVDAFLLRLLSDSPISSWELIQVVPLFKVLRYILFSMFIGGTIFVCWHSRFSTAPKTENLEFSSFLCLAILISPVSWSHYYLLLVLPVALYLGGQLGIPDNWYWKVWMAVSTVLIILPPVKRDSFNHPVIAALVRNILVSHYFWGGVLLLGCLLATNLQINRKVWKLEKETA
ncbi:glycosyltransferase family 87 protein [Calothrix sp. NIES-2098]|uniref:glycosyltransferase family 87 protein n=1 Tax=Calothrix sp. NIES-2098 TaxID=1954171 RepID=UPI000B5EEB6C|nr:hypothetical protein NIES2098_71460 [Calothrix sp. NIES-2098]